MALCRSLFLFALCGSAASLAGQTPPPGATAALEPASASAAPAQLPSTTMQESLDVLKTALSMTRIDRWRASSAIKGEAQSNVASIQRDVDQTLPALLAAADAAPASASRMLPAYRNVEALYDVMLRVDAAARLAAPSDQMSAIDQALAQLDSAQRALGDQLQQSTDAQEKQVQHLEAALRAIPPPAPPAPPPPPPAPVKCPTPVRRRKPTTAAKPTTPQPSSQNSATTPH